VKKGISVNRRCSSVINNVLAALQVDKSRLVSLVCHDDVLQFCHRSSKLSLLLCWWCRSVGTTSL